MNRKHFIKALLALPFVPKAIERMTLTPELSKFYPPTNEEIASYFGVSISEYQTSERYRYNVSIIPGNEENGEVWDKYLYTLYRDGNNIGKWEILTKHE